MRQSKIVDSSVVCWGVYKGDVDLIKKFTWVVLVILVVGLMLTNPVLADDEGVDVSITVWGDNPDVWANIQGDNPDTWIDIEGKNPNVWVNGQYLGSFATQADLGRAISAAVRSSVPNGRYSGGSSLGFEGPFNIRSNAATVTVAFPNGEEVTYSVYKGAGCGVWGVSDAYNDNYMRRWALGALKVFEDIYNRIFSLWDMVTDLITRVETLENANYDGQIEWNATKIRLLAQDTGGLPQQVEEQATAIETLQHNSGLLWTLVYTLGAVVLALVLWVAYLAIRLRRVLR